MTTKKIKHEGELHITNVIIPCYVLEDGTRILSGRGLQDALGMVDDHSDSGSRLSRYLSQKTLKPFIYKGKDPGHFNPILCQMGNQVIHGYEATVLVDICEAFLEARTKIKLSQFQTAFFINFFCFKSKCLKNYTKYLNILFAIN